MVFHYRIRGGPCKNANSHIALSEDDITCYVGRDKHENEFLIKYGWPGDFWFHVDGLSSAHVYFRVKNNEKVPLGGLPIDDLPNDSIYDMMQIVKNNSIAGCKLASCKIVWTPHSNLKKTFEMDAGTVTYHNTKLCRYGRCDKDRQRVKELEKTKTERHNVNYYEEMKANERKVIERRKRERKMASTVDIYDPIHADLKAEKTKRERHGDESSGIDKGLSALEGLSLQVKDIDSPREDRFSHNNAVDNDSNDPVWMIESNSRMEEASETIRFLRERGYTREEADQVLDRSISPVDALGKLWRSCFDTVVFEPCTISNDEILELQKEETEVLKAIFGEDEEGVHFAADEDTAHNFDAVLPISTYEPPKRYCLPPPLLLEVYVDKGLASHYPFEPPVLALVGGGLPEICLKELTNRLRRVSLERCKEEQGEPQIFNLVNYVGEEALNVIQAETEALEQERLRKMDEAKAVAEAKQQESFRTIGKKTDKATFQTEADRRAYAMGIVGAVGGVSGLKTEQTNTAPKQGLKQHYQTGVTDRSLVDDLFS